MGIEAGLKCMMLRQAQHERGGGIDPGSAPPEAPSLPKGEGRASTAGQAKLIALVGVAAAAVMTPLVAEWEGKSNDPYRDLVGVWTVCHGETRVPMRRYSDAECEAMLAEAIGGFAAGVLARNPGLRDRPHALAAATSLAYNIGLAAYRRSTVARRFEQGRWREGCDAILLWNRAGGRVISGLVRRREAERRICLESLE